MGVSTDKGRRGFVVQTEAFGTAHRFLAAVRFIEVSRARPVKESSHDAKRDTMPSNRHNGYAGREKLPGMIGNLDGRYDERHLHTDRLIDPVLAGRRGVT